MRGVSKLVRGVVAVSLFVSLAVPMEARPSSRQEVARDKGDVVQIVMNWLARMFGEELPATRPGTVQSTGDGLSDPKPTPPPAKPAGGGVVDPEPEEGDGLPGA